MSKTKSFIFKGKQSFSSSKLEQISLQFNKCNSLDSEIYSNEIYLILANSDTPNLDGIMDVLSASILDKDFSFYVGPRLGTISPWSSKTEDIVKNVGLDNIIRIERLFGFMINEAFDNQNIDLSMFYDRMTQSIYPTQKDFQNLFVSDKPRLLNYIDIINKGKEELEIANNSFGFAMSGDEIDYLYDFYSNE